MRKVCFFTGTRAEYGLLRPLIKKAQEDNDLELQLIVTSMHLSPEFGFTVNDIVKDGFKIDEQVEMLLSSDTPVGICKSMGLGIIGFAEALNRLRPDIIVLLGDRFETFAASSSAMVLKIPIAHLYGGEATEGLIDESIRHSITKMSQIHFTATEEYRFRVIQLGESPNRVFNVGSIGVENIRKLNFLKKKEVEEIIGLKEKKHMILVTFHSVTLEDFTAKKQFQNLLDSIDEISDINVVFTKTNADTNGRIINEMIDQYTFENPEKTVSFTSMGEILYLSTMKYSTAVVGNSSSGIIEAPSYCIPTVNIGDRQRGRIQAKSILNCMPTKGDIIQTLRKAFVLSDNKKIDKIVNPYEQKNTTLSIMKTIKEINLNKILKKEFYDL